MCLLDSGHIYVCSCHALSHTLHLWNSSPLNWMCSISICLFHDWINSNTWTTCCTKLSYNPNFKGRSNGGKGYTDIVRLIWDFIVFMTKIKNRSPIFGSCSQFRGSPGLGNKRKERICPLFWKLIALKDEFQSSGPQTKMVSSSSKIQFGVDR